MGLCSHPRRSSPPDPRLRGGLCLPCSIEFLGRAHELGFRCGTALHFCDTAELPDAALGRQYLHPEDQLITRFHRLTEARLVYADEIVELVCARRLAYGSECQ